MAIFGPTRQTESGRPFLQTHAQGNGQIHAAGQGFAACPPRVLNWPKIITGWQRGGGGGGGAISQHADFFILSYQLSRVKEKYNETLTTLTSILSPSFNLKKSEVEELGTRKKGRKLLFQFQMILNITEIFKGKSRVTRCENTLNHASRRQAKSPLTRLILARSRIMLISVWVP